MKRKRIKILLFCLVLILTSTGNAYAACNHIYKWTWSQSMNGLTVKDVTSSGFPSVVSSSYDDWNGIVPNVSLTLMSPTSSAEGSIMVYDEALTGSTLAHTYVYRYFGTWIPVGPATYEGLVLKASITFDNRDDTSGRFVNRSFVDRTKTTVHEFGHALGMDHPTCQISSVMHQGHDSPASMTISEHDREMFRLKW